MFYVCKFFFFCCRLNVIQAGTSLICQFTGLWFNCSHTLGWNRVKSIHCDWLVNIFFSLSSVRIVHTSPVPAVNINYLNNFDTFLVDKLYFDSSIFIWIKQINDEHYWFGWRTFLWLFLVNRYFVSRLSAWNVLFLTFHSI